MGGMFASESRPSPQPAPPPPQPEPPPPVVSTQPTSADEYTSRKRAEEARSALGESSESRRLLSSLGGN